MYILPFIDDISRNVWIHLVKHKSEVLNRFKLNKAMIEKKIGRMIMCLTSDKGLEFYSDVHGQVYTEEGIVKHYTIVDTLQPNAIIKLMNKIILERARSLFSNTQLDKNFSEEAINTTCSLVNRSLPPIIDWKALEKT